jgi:class 3 adenylate cyclase
VLTSSSNQKQTGFIWVFLLAVLLLTPLAWMHQMLDELRIKDESSLDLQARERLLNEMASFQEQLRPEKHIEMALDELRADFGLEIAGDSPHSLAPTAGIDPMLIRSDFPASASAYLQAKFRIRPLLSIAIDCDMQNIYSWYSQPLFPDAAQQKHFEHAAAFWMAFTATDMVNELPSSMNLEFRKMQHMLEVGITGNNYHLGFSQAFNKYVSVFGTPPTSPAACRAFFSNRFGGQRSYQIFHLIKRQRTHRTASLLGGYYFVFNSTDISPTAMLKYSLKNEDIDLQRHFVKNPIEQPYFVSASNHLHYYASLPSYFLTLVEDYAIKNPQTSSELRKFIDQHSLVVTIDKKHLISPYAMAQKLCSALFKAALLIFFALLVRSFMLDLEQGLRLSKKLRIAVAIIVMLPILGVFLVSEQIKTSNEKLTTIKYLNRIRQRLDLFEKIIGETDPRLTLMFQEDKELLAHLYYNLSDISISELIQQGHFRVSRSSIVESGLDREGRNLGTDPLRPRRDNTSLRAALFSIMQNLGAINSESAEIKKIHKQMTFVVGLAGSIANLFANPEALARESLALPHIFSASALTRSVHFFIAHPKTPNLIDAATVSYVDDVNVFKQLYFQLANSSMQLFSDYDENCQIDYMLALRSPSALRQHQAPFYSAGNEQLRKLAANALHTRTSSTSIKRLQDRLLINSWIVSDISPVIILARAVLKPQLVDKLFFSMIPWALLIYAFLAVVLISDLLADIFLTPVNALIRLVNKLRRNELQTSVVISSGDEFEELGNSFNKMCEGLVQREKMRRFVSEKLFTSLESGGDTQQPGKTSLSILSSDIRGFTALSEQYPPEEIVSLLNDYFSTMEEALGLHGGAIEKIVGDAITAAFYDDPNLPHYSARACQAAREMKKRLAEFNQARQNAGKFTIATGIGIASGEAVLGFTAGRARRREFILIGEVTHRAELLESMTRWSKNSVLVDSTTATLANEDCRRINIGENDQEEYLELKLV